MGRSTRWSRATEHGNHMLPLGSLLFLNQLFVSLLLVQAEDNNNNRGNEYHCTDLDATAVSSSVPLHSLQPNAFHKICPQGNNYQFLGQPSCGDGSAFAFYVTRPTQRKANTDRVMIEFAGGGACWDAETCEYQQNYLTFPEQWNDFVGLSCSEIEQGMQQQNKGLSMLCAKQVGAVDLTAYTTIVVPYCTQDVHSGDNIITYYNNNNNENNDEDQNNEGNTVVHRGAHNMMAVLRYVYKNFPNPQHIVLTGCSAGGTALPVAYHLIHKHYNSFVQSTQVSVIADSPVFLTPSYFLQNSFDNWNPWTIVQRIGFRYKKYKHDTAYPTELWDYILKQGRTRDQWGFVTHTNDPVSQAYYQWMSGNSDNNNRKQRNLDNVDENNEWWTELSSALETIQSQHKNVQTYIMPNEEAHCTFGLYHGLQQDGFDDWASDILQEQRVGSASSTAGQWLFAVALGVFLSYGVLRVSHQRRNYNSTISDMDDSGLFRKFDEANEDGGNDSDNDGFSISPSEGGGPTSFPLSLQQHQLRAWRHYCKAWLRWTGAKASARGTRMLQSLELYPITAGYSFALSLYLGILLLREGLTHPLNNPAIGPSAIALSAYGINNPSLIVYKSQLFRLVTSVILCSGIVTYALTMLSLWLVVRPLEMRTAPSSRREFGLLCGLILVGCNLIYAVIGNGASCSSLACVLGLQAFVASVRIKMKRRSGDDGDGKCFLIFMTALVSLLASLVFTFNSWIMIIAALILGGLVIPNFILDIALPEQEDKNYELHHDSDGDGRSNVLRTKIGIAAGDKLMLATRRPRLNVLLALYGIMLLLLIFRIRRPNRLFAESPYYTGCDVKYSDALQDVDTSKYFGGADEDRFFRLVRARRIEEENDDGLCAQVCIPHLVSRWTTLGARAVFSFEMNDGFCPSNYEHYVDKTFRYFTYSLDVEIFQQANSGE